MRIVEDRLEQDRPPSTIFIGARTAGTDAAAPVLVSVTERWKSGGCTATPSEPPVVQESIAALGAVLHTTIDPQMGRTTLLRLAVDAR